MQNYNYQISEDTKLLIDKMERLYNWLSEFDNNYKNE